jgi:hypothetical protein
MNYCHSVPQISITGFYLACGQTITRVFEIMPFSSSSPSKFVPTLPTLAFRFSTIGWALLPVLGSIASITFATIASREARKRNDSSARRLSSLSLLLGYAGLAFWIILLGIFILITRH